MSGGLLLAVESSCDETGVALLDGPRRIVAQAVASQVALHAGDRRHRPRGCGTGPPALDRPGARRGPGGRQARRSPTCGTWPSPPARGWSARSSWASSYAKAIAWALDVPLVGVNHLEGHLYAAWLLDPDEPERPEPAFPLVALVVSGGHTFLVEMRDHLEYRLLGETVDDAAGEAFDKAGRLLGLGYPGGPAIAAAAGGAVGPPERLPRAWMGNSYDFSFSGLKTALRRLVEAELAARRPAGGRGGRPPPRPAGRGARGGLPGERRRRPGRQDAAGRGGDRRPFDRRRRRRGVERRAARAAGRRCRRARRRPRHPAAGAVHGQRGDDRRRRRAPVGGGRARGPRPRRARVVAAGAAGRVAPRRAARRRAAPRHAPTRLHATRRPTRPGEQRRDRRASPDPPGSRRGPPDAPRCRDAGPAALLPELPRGCRRPGGDPRGRVTGARIGACWRSGPASGS